MIKFIIPTLIIFLIVLFWEKINEKIYKKFNIRLNYLMITAVSIIIAILFFLIKN